MYADASKLESMLNLNCYHVMSLMHSFTQRLKIRSQHSGIVVISSLAGMLPTPGNLTYSASKAFCRSLCKAVNWEIKSAELNIDVLCTMPSFVETKMIAHLKKPANSIPVGQFVDTALRDLGQTEESNGAFRHELTGVIGIFGDKYLQSVLMYLYKLLVAKG